MSKKNKQNQRQHSTGEELTLSDKINNFLYENRRVMLITLMTLAVVFVAIVAVSYFVSMKKANSIAKVETIVLNFEKFKTKELKNSIDELTKAEKSLLEQKENAVIEDLLQFADKHSYVGFMANTEIAEIYHSRKDWEKALQAYEKAGSCASSSYAAGSALFNAATCADEIGNLEKAVEMYKKVSEAENFPFRARALFNVARMQEKTDINIAIENYNKVAIDFPNTEWAKLSKTRAIQLSLKK